MTTGMVGASSPPSPWYVRCTVPGGESPLSDEGGEEPLGPLLFLLRPCASLQGRRRGQLAAGDNVNVLSQGRCGCTLLGSFFYRIPSRIHTLLHVNTPVVSAGRSQSVVDGIQVDVLLALALAVGAAGQVSRAQARGGVGNQTGSEGRERTAARLNDITLSCR